MEKFKQFLDSVDGDLKKIFDYQKEYIHCKKGCSYCCQKGDYPISKLEYKYMMLAYSKLDENIKEKIRQNVEKIKNSNSELYICPFLIEGNCSIYTNRPFVCRTFGVLTEDASGRPSFPFCATMGLNFSEIYDKETQHLSPDLFDKGGFKVFPQIFRVSNKVIMNLPLAKNLGIDFGECKKMIDFLELE